MFVDFLPIRLYTGDMLRQAKIKIASQASPFSFSKGFSCFSCPWENICINNLPCLVFAYSAYTPRHFLTAVKKLGYNVLLFEGILHRRKLRITFEDGKSFTFAVALLISSTECIHIAQQLLLRWHVSKLPKNFYVMEPLPRYYYLPRL